MKGQSSGYKLGLRLRATLRSRGLISKLGFRVSFPKYGICSQSYLGSVSKMWGMESGVRGHCFRNFRKFPEIAGNCRQFAGNCWQLLAAGGGGGPAISGNFRKFCQKFPAISGNCRKLPRTAFLGKIGGNFRNCWKLPEISGNYRKFPEIAGNFRNCRKLRKFPEIAGHSRPPGPLFDPHLPLFQARPLFGPPFSPHP